MLLRLPGKKQGQKEVVPPSSEPSMGFMGVIPAVPIIADGIVAGAIIIWEWLTMPKLFPSPEDVLGEMRRQMFEEHRTNKRKSNQPKHEKGKSRRQRDGGGEKADPRRRPPLQKPPNHKGPWPPKNFA